ncbi:sugar ABC transporter permease [Propioniciclava soli]|uniref:Sugar ABC transporter permease n=1 Tax=Propioniciclava soli TaxID=2775081 RepID=A0ABZ3C9J3_9ACTN
MASLTETPLTEPAARPRRRRHRSAAAAVWWLMLPAAALYIFAVIIPSVQGGAYSLTDWDGVSTDSQFVGLRQYVLIFTDPYGQTAVKNTVLITVVVTIVQNLLGFFIALGVNARIKSRNILRVLFFAPVVITSIAIGFLWQNLFAPNGAINQVLELVGLGALRQDWLGNADLVVWSIMIVII